MADSKISTLTALAGANVAGTDVLPIVDVSATTTKKITVDELAIYLGALATFDVTALDDIVDVTITTAANGDLLKWNGTAWVNAAGYALLASPTFTGTVTIPSGASISGFAPLASPTFSGTVTMAAGASIEGTSSEPVKLHGLELPATHMIRFEGTTDDAFETFLTVVDPTADRTVTFQDATGTVAFTSDSQNDQFVLAGAIFNS